MRRPGGQRGLTLVELLVTLVLVGLAASLVVGGIGQASALLMRVTADQGTVYHELMARAWLRQTLAAAVAPLDEERNFAGGAQELRFSSFRPLLGSEGVATVLEWRAGAQGGLEYLEGDQVMQVAAMPPLLRFEYQDTQLVWHEQWPVEDSSGLPERVALVFAGDDDRLDVQLRTRRAPFVNNDEEMYERE